MVKLVHPIVERTCENQTLFDDVNTVKASDCRKISKQLFLLNRKLVGRAIDLLLLTVL